MYRFQLTFGKELVDLRLADAEHPAFRDTQSEARRLGWTVSELDVGHMAPLIDPDLVCHTILEKA